MQDEVTAAELVAEWRRLRSSGKHVRSVIASGVGRSRGSALVASVSQSVGLGETANVQRYDANGKPVQSAEDGAEANLLLHPSPPELMFGVALVRSGRMTPDGALIVAVEPAWLVFIETLVNDPLAFAHLSWRQTEELVAGAYREDGWSVTLTPRSGDRGRDVIAYRDDIGEIRVLDQVKHYAPGHFVDAGDVREMLGVLSLDLKASKAAITTTSRFAPGVFGEFAPVLHSRLQLRDGDELRKWLRTLSEKTRMQ